MTITDKLRDKWKKVDVGVRDLIKLGTLTAAFLGMGIAHEYYWRNHTETGREWIKNVNAHYEEFKQNTTLSDYDRVEKIVSKFYGVR